MDLHPLQCVGTAKTVKYIYRSNKINIVEVLSITDCMSPSPAVRNYSAIIILILFDFKLLSRLKINFSFSLRLQINARRLMLIIN